MRGQTGPPSQYTALQQLKYRMSLDKPILVSIIAPAGFGKSELLAAWQYYLMTQRLEWATLATTGVSSTTLGGVYAAVVPWSRQVWGKHDLQQAGGAGTSNPSSRSNHR